MSTATIPAPPAHIGESATALYHVDGEAPRLMPLPLALDLLAALGRDREDDRARLLRGDILTTETGASCALSVHSLYEIERGPIAVADVPMWYLRDVSSYRARRALWEHAAPERAALDARRAIERARGYGHEQAEYVAQGGEQREEQNGGAA